MLPRQPIIGNSGTGQRAECLPHFVDAADLLPMRVRHGAVALDVPDDLPVIVQNLKPPPVVLVY